MKQQHAGLLVAVLFAIAAVAVTNAQSATPYKLGMFQQGTRSFVGMVIQNDTVVLDLSRANVGAPATLKQLIAGWDANTGTRLAALATSATAKAPAFAMKVSAVKTLPPIPGKVMQDSNTDRMTHNVYELVEYASHLFSLKPGDMISSGSPAGVGTARGTPIYFKDGDTSTCTIASIGTLENPVRAEK